MVKFGQAREIVKEKYGPLDAATLNQTTKDLLDNAGWMGYKIRTNEDFTAMCEDLDRQGQEIMDERERNK